MAKHGRGLICLAMTDEQVTNPGLSPMSGDNGMRHSTAFTVSIEARDGVSTGISAADRARTISVAIRPNATREEIVSPGHIFPLTARDGGVLVRAGHTEAAVDVARLAGLIPAGVICEIMNDDGSMARMPDLKIFAATHGLKIGTIRDLIAYRRNHDHLVERATTNTLTSDYGGDWKVMIYRNKVDSNEAVVLQKGTIERDCPTLVRMHAASLFHDMLGKPGPRKRLLQRAMAEIGREGAGVLVLLTAQQPGDLENMVTPTRAPMDDRTYGIGAQILADIGVHDMILLTNTSQTLVALEGYGLSIVGRRPIPPLEEEANVLQMLTSDSPIARTKQT
jgi:3,4-dihydroxy 2-butanone 4-phosphate synthase/GTP cyclohydrolase II